MAIVRGGPVTAHAQSCVDALQTDMPHVTSFGTYEGHQPTKQRAVDIFHAVSDTRTSREITDWLVSRIKTYGIDYIISRRLIFNPEVSPAWRTMPDRGSPTANHEDHVHVSFDATVTAQAAKPPKPLLPALGPEILLLSLAQARVLDIPFGQQANGVRPGLWTVNALRGPQRFRQTGRDANGNQFVVCSTQPNLVLDVDVATGNLQLWEFHGGANQQFKFMGGPVLGTWAIRCEANGRYLAPALDGIVTQPAAVDWATPFAG